MLARNEQRLAALADEIPEASSFPCDVSASRALAESFAHVVRDLGPPEVVIHNAVGGAFGDFLSIDPQVLERNFQVNTMALLYLARLAAPAMLEAKKGAILCTGNTSTYRGKAGFAGFAPTKAAQRILAESIARSVGPRGIHVAYLAIDAVIDVPWTRRAFPDRADEFFCRPDDIANECWHIVHQPRSAWSFDLQIRPDGEDW